MKRTITAYEAPALVAEHGSMTPLELYDRLTAAPGEPPEAGLTSRIAAGAVEQAAVEHGWSNPNRKDFRVDVAGDGDGVLSAHARGFVVRDEEGEFLAVFQHVAQFVHANAWNKAGVAPQTAVDQAAWAMMTSGHRRLAFVVLADKRLVVYWVARDEDLVERLRAGAADMARRIAAGDPPALDAAPASAVAEPAVDGSVDKDALAARWRQTQIERAVAANAVQTRDHAYEAATTALKAAIVPGASHDYDGFRIHHNAKTGRLTEEKIDGLYF